LLDGRVRAAEFQTRGGDCCRFIVEAGALPSPEEQASE
jgi:hypothetical protein